MFLIYLTFVIFVPFNNAIFPRFQNQDYKTLYSNLKTGELFVDPVFGTPKLEEEINYKITWLRPKEIVTNPFLYSGKLSKDDIKQGSLGDCWFIAALSNLLYDEDILWKVVPLEQSFQKYHGIFHFRFWLYDDWIDVVIDDRLPTYKDKNNKIQLLYANHADGKFWVPLLEKAFAKFYGSYKRIIAGDTQEAMLHLMGGVTLSTNPSQEPKTSLLYLERLAGKSFILTAATENLNKNQLNGILTGHAYSILKVVTLVLKNGTKINLIKLRNPWGGGINSEWKGDWSDTSQKWNIVTNQVKILINYKNNLDGEFWMDYNDYTKIFNLLTIGVVHPSSAFSSDFTDLWNEYKIHDSFINNNTYTFEVKENSFVYISLIQKYRRHENKTKLLTNFLLLNPNDKVIGNYVPPKNTISVSTDITGFEVIPKGVYKILPNAKNIDNSDKNPCGNTDCAYLLRIYTSIFYAKVWNNFTTFNIID